LGHYEAVLKNPAQCQGRREGNDKTYPQEHGGQCFHERSDLPTIECQDGNSKNVVNSYSQHNNIPHLWMNPNLRTHKGACNHLVDFGEITGTNHQMNSAGLDCQGENKMG
jgi:hypothetical protein